MSKQSTVELAQKLLSTVPESEIIFHPDIVSDAKQLAQAVVSAAESIRQHVHPRLETTQCDMCDWLSKYSSGEEEGK